MKTFKPDFLQVLITGLFNFMVLTVPLFFSFNTEELFEFNKMVLVYGYTLAILLVWVTRMVLYKQLIFRTTKLDIPIFLFLLSQLLSTLFSIHPYTSLLGYYTRFHGGLLSTFSYIALYYAFVSNVESKQLKGFLYSIFGAAFLVGIYAALEHFGHSFSCYLVTNGQSFGTECWIQDVKNRVFATFGQPNWLAAYMIMLIPLAMYLGQTSVKFWQKLLWIGLTSLMFATVLFTRSRSGILGMGVGILLYGLSVAYIWWKEHELRPRLLFAKHWPLISILSVCLLFFVFINHPFAPNLSGIFSAPAAPTPTATPVSESAPVNRLEVGGSDSGEIRKIVWKGALAVWQRYPWFGSGVETFAYSYYLDRPIEHNQVTEWDFLYNKAHNEFLNFLATTGLVGLLSYCLVLGTFSFLVLKRVYQALKLENYDRALLYGSLLAGVAALSVSNFFGFSTVTVALLMFLFFAIAELFDVSLLKPLPEVKDLANWQYIVLVVVAISGLFGFYKVYSYHSADVAFTKGQSLMSQGEFQAGLNYLSLAINKNPSEALFYDTLADQYGMYSLHFANAGLATQAAVLAQRADEASQMTLQLNDRQINYYKTRARLLINLAQLNPKLLPQAEETLLQAHYLAPTDPKLVYNLGLVYIWQGKTAEGVKFLEQSIALKPDYELPRVQVAKTYQAQGNTTQALAQWQSILQLNPKHTEAQAAVASLSAQVKY